MQGLRALLLSAGICMLIVSSAVAVGVSALDLDALTHDSDLIVVGRVISVREVDTTRVTVFSQEYRARVLVGTVHVDQILKGAVSSDTVSFKFYQPETFVGWQSATVNNYAAFFLRPDSNGAWEFTNPYYPWTPALPGSSLSGSTAIDRVIESIEAVLRSSTSVLNEKLAALQVISYSRSRASDAALRSAVSQEDEDVRLGAAAVLLHRNDLSGLA
jgi:hypothetical protein